MKLSKLGGTGVEVSALSFGAAPIGNLYRATSDTDARAAVDAAWDGGMRYFDTAPHYGLGLSERRLGEALRDRPHGEFTVSTKVGRLWWRTRPARAAATTVLTCRRTCGGCGTSAVTACGAAWTRACGG